MTMLQSLLRPLRQRVPIYMSSPLPQRFGSSSSKTSTPQSAADILSTPSWDPSTLLPSQADIDTAAEQISTSQLAHLLRLSGLPAPSSSEEEAELRATLGAQLHFVRQVQAAARTPEIASLEPLQAVRDESEAGVEEATIRKVDVDEEVRGKYWPRPRRRKGEVKKPDEEWDIFANASRKVGRYFVVDGKA